MWYWAELVRLTRAMRNLYSVRSNVVPRLETISHELESCGQFAASYEIQNVLIYLRKLNRETFAEVQNQYNMIAQAYGVRGVSAPHTTPLVATNADIRTS